MKKHILLIGLILVLCPVLCRGGSGPGQLKLWGDVSDNYDDPDRGITSATLGAFWGSFLNGNYFANKADGSIVPHVGFSASGSVVLLKRVELELSYFNQKYDLTTVDAPDTKATHSGVAGGVNLFVLPPLGKVSNILCPYIGAGYQGSGLSAQKGDYNTVTSGFFAKAGLRVYVLRGLNIRAEYMQTLPTSSNKLFRTISVGVGVIM